MAKRTKDLESGLADILYTIAKDSNAIAEVKRDLSAVLALSEKNLRLKEFLRSSIVPQSAKEEVLKKIFGSSVSSVTLLFLNKVVEQEMFGRIRSILRIYMDTVSQKDNIAFAEVTSSVELDSESLARITAQTESVTGKSIELHANVDAAILGGVIIRVEGKVLDLSLSQRFADLRSKLVATV